MLRNIAGNAGQSASVCPRFNEAAALMLRNMMSEGVGPGRVAYFNEAAALMLRNMVTDSPALRQFVNNFNEAAALMLRNISGEKK